jgi:hypothetical protein
MIPKPSVSPKQTSLHPTISTLLRRTQPFIWQGKPLPAFWTVSGMFSITLNIILITLLIVVGRQLFALKALVEDGLIEGLYQNFVLMDQAHIITDIQVNAPIPIQFDLPVSTQTTVYLTKDVTIPNTWVALNTAGQGINLSINAPADITLPVNTPLDIQLEILVPVSTTIPVNLPVHVDIPLNQTQLHEPFVGLQNVVSPYRSFLSGLPNSWDETPLCASSTDWVCQRLLQTR